MIDAGFSLDWLGRGSRPCSAFRLLQRLGVAEGDDPEARCERPEMLHVRAVSVLKPMIPRVRPWKLSAQT